MAEAFMFETPLWEIAARGTAACLVIALVLRFLPKRHTGNLAPNHMISLVMVGTLPPMPSSGMPERCPACSLWHWW